MKITVHGQPAPQGSKRHVGHGVMIESSRHVKPWREAVKYAALDARERLIDPERGETDPIAWGPLTGPVRLHAVFTFTRPRSHYRTGRNAGLLRDDAPTYKISKPDGEKLERSTYDALTDAGIWRDDAQVDVAGAVIEIEAAT